MRIACYNQDINSTKTLNVLFWKQEGGIQPNEIRFPSILDVKP